MMLFDDAFTLLEIGTPVAVTREGDVEPPAGTEAWKLWRHNNHQGTIIAKADGPPQSITVELDMEEIAPGIFSTPAYEVVEGGGHDIAELAPPASSKLTPKQANDRAAAASRARLARMRPEDIIAELQTQMLVAFRTLFPDLVISADVQQQLFPNARDDKGPATTPPTPAPPDTPAGPAAGAGAGPHGK